MHRLQPLLFQPVPSETAYPLTELMQEVRAGYFPEIDADVEVRIAASGPLAWIAPSFMGENGHLVVFHPVLNHPETPIEVLRFICKHELTHIVRPGRVIAGYYESHPDEFWEHEAEVGPERFAVWHWVWGNLRGCLRETDAGLRVARRWRTLQPRWRRPYMPSLPFKGERWDIVCPGDGGQLRLPPSWVVPPHPMKRHRRPRRLRT
ncbi:MAG: hypothetical protein M0R74_14995 [Dehalococcoidia bacterium]|nr:hypothetical protein [Dehalococcoidia bacterium]